MLVMIAEEQIVSLESVCQNCLMANQSGLPRWHQGKLSCGQAIKQATDKSATIYECQMGFRVTEIE
ncbi:hypothetical protein [Myxosarcina sp. GI1(2024)]